MTPCIRRDFVVLKKDKGNLVKLRLLSVSSIVLIIGGTQRATPAGIVEYERGKAIEHKYSLGDIILLHIFLVRKV